MNSRANALAKGAASGEYFKKKKLILKEDYVEKEKEERPYEINMVDISNESSEGCSWMKEIVDFL